MSKKIILLFAVIIFFSLFHFASASLVINEIMYDLEGTDTGREWVEVYNNTDASVDLSTFKFFEANTNHQLNIIEGDKNLGAGGYALIVSDATKFKADWPLFVGTIFDSSFSLGNEGELLGIKNADLNLIDEYSYSSSLGGTGNGKSLQKVSSSWTEGSPTPGVTNQGSTLESSVSPGGNNSSTENTTTITPQTKKSEEPKIKTKITAKTLVFATVPTELEGNATGLSGEQLYYGKYFWNFGDGDSKEVQVNNITSIRKLTHTYFYPGEYTVVLEYYRSMYVGVPDASDKFMIKVVALEIAISRVGEAGDFFIELSNNIGYDVDISNWILASSAKSFTFSKNTIINSKKKIIFSPNLTQFSILDKNTLRLMSPQGKVIFDYGASVVKQEIPPLLNPISPHPIPLLVKEREQTEIPAENLPASVISSEVTTDGSIRTYALSLTLTLFLGLSAGFVYFIRQKKTLASAGDDFNILDE